MLVRDSFYIDGAWVSPAASETLDVIDSTTEEVFATIPAGTPADVDRAVQAAHRAFPAWAATPAKDRGALLQKIAEGLQARAGEMADVISHEVGMPRTLTEPDPGRPADRRVHRQRVACRLVRLARGDR